MRTTDKQRCSNCKQMITKAQQFTITGSLQKKFFQLGGCGGWDGALERYPINAVCCNGCQQSAIAGSQKRKVDDLGGKGAKVVKAPRSFSPLDAYLLVIAHADPCLRPLEKFKDTAAFCSKQLHAVPFSVPSLVDAAATIKPVLFSGLPVLYKGASLPRSKTLFADFQASLGKSLVSIHEKTKQRLESKKVCEAWERSGVEFLDKRELTNIVGVKSDEFLSGFSLGSIDSTNALVGDEVFRTITLSPRLSLMHSHDDFVFGMVLYFLVVKLWWFFDGDEAKDKRCSALPNTAHPHNLDEADLFSLAEFLSLSSSWWCFTVPGTLITVPPRVLHRIITLTITLGMCMNYKPRV